MKLAHSVSCCIRLMTICIMLLLSTVSHAADASYLTVTKDGDGTGTVRSQAGVIDCGDICSSVFASIETVYLTAIPDPDSYFTGWSGGCSSQALTCAVDMTFDRTVTATFTTTPPTVSNWGKRFDMNLDAGNAVIQTRDGGYVVAGRLNDQSVLPGMFSVIRLNAAGDIIWKKHYQGAASSEATAIREDASGNFIVAGRYLSYNFAYTPMLLLIDSNGDLVVARNLVTNSNGSYSGNINGIDLDNTGVVMAGYVQDPDSGSNNTRLWVGEMTFVVDPVLPEDSPRWQMAVGGSGYESANAVRMTTDGGYIVAGETTSISTVDNDAWLIKVATGGAVGWQKIYGGSGNDAAKDIRQTSDGGYVVAGYTGSPIAGPWVAKLDNAGNIVWQNVYGPGEARSIQQTIDGGYIVAGGTVQSVSYGGDAWLMKLNADGSVAWRRTYGSAGKDEIRSVQQAADGGYILTGMYNSSDMLVLKTDESGNVYGCGLDFSALFPVTPVAAAAVASDPGNAVTFNRHPGSTVQTGGYTMGIMGEVVEDITLPGGTGFCSGSGPALSVTPMVLYVNLQTQGYNMGITPPNKQLSQIVTIDNNGNQPLTISSFAQSGTSPTFSLTAYSGPRPCNGFPKTIAAGDYCTVAVNYYPTAVGGNYATFRLISNDPNRPDITMRFAAICGNQLLQPQKSTLAFGPYHVQTPSYPQILTLKNTNATTGDVQINTVAITGANANEFAVTANNCPAQLPPQATCTLEVTFTPLALGMRSASLDIASSDPLSPATIALTGIGGYYIMVNNQDYSGGTVTNTGGNIDCGTTCYYLIGNVQTIELNATPVPGFQFTGWSGAGCSGTGGCSVTMNQDRTVTANFFGYHTFSVLFDPLGTGTGSVSVTTDTTSQTFNTSQQLPFVSMSTILLSGIPDQYSVFTGWDGNLCIGNEDCQFGLDGDYTVSATFDFDAAHMIYNPDRDIYYSSLQTAYDEALDGNRILVWGVTDTEDLYLGQQSGQHKDVTIKGGYDQGYGQNNDVTYLKGRLIISRGKVVAERIVIQQ